jgi:hypothetical protein
MTTTNHTVRWVAATPTLERGGWAGHAESETTEHTARCPHKHREMAAAMECGSQMATDLNAGRPVETAPGPPGKVPAAVVVDERDAYTWARDTHGQPFTEETATAFAQALNDERKPEHRTFRVYALVPIDARGWTCQACSSGPYDDDLDECGNCAAPGPRQAEPIASDLPVPGGYR